MRCIEFLHLFFFQNSKFWNRNTDFSIFNNGIQKKNPTGIFGIKNGIRIPLLMGVPEIGTKNRNSQPSRVLVVVTDLIVARAMIFLWSRGAYMTLSIL
jgi:hypothetical protein